MNPLLQGLILGFSLAVPVGPIALLCIRRTLTNGHLVGIFTGLGAAVADAVYGTVAAYGLTCVSNCLSSYHIYLATAGGLFLIYLGYNSFTSKVVDHQVTKRHENLIGAFSSTFFLTLSNPITILTFTALFATLNIHTADFYSGTLVISGVFLGSAIWWIILSSIISLIRKRITHSTIHLINKVSGTLIAAFGIFVLFSIAKPYIF